MASSTRTSRRRRDVHPDADIFLDDVTVSRRHAEFLRHRTAFEVKDLSSLNGTYFDGVRIETALLSDGAEVQIGKYRLTFYASRRDLAPLGGGYVPGTAASSARAAGANSWHRPGPRTTSARVPRADPSKLRFLEEQRLVSPARTAAGYRKFSEADVERITVVLSMQRDQYLRSRSSAPTSRRSMRARPPRSRVPRARRSCGRAVPTRRARGGGRRHAALLDEAISASLLPAAELYGDDALGVLRRARRAAQRRHRAAHLRGSAPPPNARRARRAGDRRRRGGRMPRTRRAPPSTRSSSPSTSRRCARRSSGALSRLAR